MSVNLNPSQGQLRDFIGALNRSDTHSLNVTKGKVRTTYSNFEDPFVYRYSFLGFSYYTLDNNDEARRAFRSFIAKGK